MNNAITLARDDGGGADPAAAKEPYDIALCSYNLTNRLVLL